ncbi:peptide chain release factor N(5)-glutamine methyltransferase [Candidatus Gracilibacteria bacterium]|nr:peptide chain release factor N(5)-glutamine methyltransferase [Candidatus Gracilibacteria bacterium]
MIIKELLQKSTQELPNRELGRLEVEVLLAHALGFTKEQLFCAYDQDASDASLDLFYAGLDRLKEGEPLSYVIGEKEFYDLSFKVGKGVLIPRPETEWLVEKIISLSTSHFSTGASIADIGTGSGCIGVSLAKNLPTAKIVLVDISPDALDIARENVSRHAVGDRALVIQSDLLNTIIDQHFDIIVANLPYIGEKKFHFVAQDVDKYEPHIALYGGHDGLQLYKKMFQQIQDMKSKPSYLFGEFGFAQTEDISSLLDTFFVQSGGVYEIVPDLAGIDRYFIVSLAGLPL